MSDTRDGGPAFPQRDLQPHEAGVFYEGLSLRDYFAAQVMDRMISLSIDHDGGWSVENVAAGCYNLADAMLKAREAPHG